MTLNNYIQKAINYKQYRNLLQDLMAQGKTTGDNQSEEYLHYAKLNLQRMLRLEKTTVLSTDLTKACASVTKEVVWLVITEGWCGDAAQNIPVFEKITEICDKIELKLILRDEHPELMNAYLTNGSKAIPKLICVEKVSGKELFVWGPRPADLQTLVMDLKAEGASLEDKSLQVQKWYNADKTLSVQAEFTTLLRNFLS